MTTITLEHVSKRFRSDGGDTIAAIDNISLKIPSGQVMSFLGPSGSGKSTLLRLVAGLVKPDSGVILYDKINLANISPEHRNIGMVFQDSALIPHWRARLNIGFWMRLRQREPEVPARVKRISNITGIGLDKLLDRYPRQLSGGEQQRVGVARALTRDLNVLLLDEPFSNLDAKFRTEARLELKRLLREFPVTTIFVTHDQTEARALSDRIAVLRDGHVVQVGTYHTLADNPINLFIATFMGTPTINLFEGRVEDGHWVGENFGGYPIRDDFPNGTPVTLGVRAHNMRLESGGVPGVVERVTPFYSERTQLLDMWLGNERWQIVLPLDEPIEQGTTHYCAIDPDGILYFDTATGQRIG